MQLKHLFATTALVAALSFSALTAQAVTLSSTDFESFALGSVNGQGGWSSTGPYDQAVVDDGTGNQALRISNGVTTGAFGDQTFAPRPGGTSMTSANPTGGNPGFFAGQSSTGAAFNNFSMSFRFRAETTAVQSGLFISVSADNGQGGRQTYLGIADNGGVGLDLITYNVDALGGFIGPIAVGTVDRTSWHSIDVDVQFGDGAMDDVVRLSVDGGLPIQTTSWEQFYAINQPLLHPLGVPVQTALFRAGGTAAPNILGHGLLFDDVVTQVSEVPEPETLAVLALGLAGIAITRRRRALA